MSLRASSAIVRSATPFVLAATLCLLSLVACGDRRPPVTSGGTLTSSPASDPGPAPSSVRLDLSTFWKPWFDQPYEYMFTGPQGQGWANSPALASEGQVFGAGVSGFYFYGGLDDCLRAALGQEVEYGHDEYASLSEMAGRPFKVGEVGDGWQRGFSRYDPAVIDWAVATLLPRPEQRFASETFQRVYDRTFFRVVRLHALAYALLRVRYDIDSEAAAYVDAMNNDPDFDGMPWLQARYGGDLAGAWPLPNDGTSLTGEMVMGFWLRRHVDGTEASLVNGLGLVLRNYDQGFLDQLGAGAGLFGAGR